MEFIMDRKTIAAMAVMLVGAGCAANLPQQRPADLTVTMGYPKLGLAAAPALDYVGSVDVVDIGIPEFLAERITASSDLITAADLYPLFRRRDRRLHCLRDGHGS